MHQQLNATLATQDRGMRRGWDHHRCGAAIFTGHGGTQAVLQVWAPRQAAYQKDL